MLSALPLPAPPPPVGLRRHYPHAAQEQILCDLHHLNAFQLLGIYGECSAPLLQLLDAAPRSSADALSPHGYHPAHIAALWAPTPLTALSVMKRYGVDLTFIGGPSYVSALQYLALSRDDERAAQMLHEEGLDPFAATVDDAAAHAADSALNIAARMGRTRTVDFFLGRYLGHMGSEGCALGAFLAARKGGCSDVEEMIYCKYLLPFEHDEALLPLPASLDLNDPTLLPG